MPEFLIQIRNISVGICMYLEKGKANRNVLRVREYAHHTGCIRFSLVVKVLNIRLIDIVRKLPPLIPAVKLSANNLKGNIYCYSNAGEYY